MLAGVDPGGPCSDTCRGGFGPDLRRALANLWAAAESAIERGAWRLRGDGREWAKSRGRRGARSGRMQRNATGSYLATLVRIYAGGGMALLSTPVVK